MMNQQGTYGTEPLVQGMTSPSIKRVLITPLGVGI
jgi:hypothetical protein